jgi:transposase
LQSEITEGRRRRGAVMNGSPRSERAVAILEEVRSSGPDPEVAARPRRRRFTAAYKLEILRRAEACTKSGEVGELLRREGLYSSHLSSWRKQRDEGGLARLSLRRGRKPRQDAKSREIEGLRREKALLERRLEQAELIIEVQKKLSRMWGIDLPSPPSDGSR